MARTFHDSMHELDATHPRLTKLYERMMTTARIVTPPKLELLPLDLVALADYGSDTIVIDPDFIEQAPAGHTKAVIGHEAGHLLADKRTTIFTPSCIIRDKEQEADRIAVHLTGSHDDVSAMRQKANAYIRDAWRPSNQWRLSPDSVVGRAVRKYEDLNPLYKRAAASHWQGYVRHYGTPEELEANIRGVDLSDRTHLDALIEQRNKRTNPELY